MSLAALGAALALLAAPAAAKPRVLVLQVRAEQGIERGTANLIGELLVEDIHKSGRFDTIAHSDLAAILDVDRQKQLVGCDDTGCLSEIGDALGAELIVEASVGTVGLTRVLTVKLIDVSAASVRAREGETVAGDDALIDATHRVVARLLGIAVPEPEERAGLRPGWYVLGGGALLAGAGAVFGAMALGDYHRFEANPFDDAAGDAASTKALVADGLFAAGALAITGGLVWLLSD